MEETDSILRPITRTTIRTPLTDRNHIRLQHGTEDRFYTGHTKNTSVVDLEVGDGS